MTAMPADAYTLARPPLVHAGSDGIDDANNFMAGHARILQSGPVAFLYERIAVADATSLYLDPHLTGSRLLDFSLDNFEWTTRAGNLCNAHS
jgi:hypothetical protein